MQDLINTERRSLAGFRLISQEIARGVDLAVTFAGYLFSKKEKILILTRFSRVYVRFFRRLDLKLIFPKTCWSRFEKD